MSTTERAGMAADMGARVLRLDRRRLLIIVGLGVLTMGLLVALSGGQAALQALVQANWWLVLLAVMVHYSSFAVRGHRWQRLLKMLGHPLGYLYTTAVLLAGWFVSALLPARAGDVLRIAVLRLDTERHPPVPVADSLSSILLERVLDIVAILVLGAVFGFAMLRDQAPGWLLTSYATGLVLLLGFGLALLMAPPILTWLGGRSRNRWWQAGVHFLEQVVNGLRTLFRHPGTAVLVTVESLYIWMCDALLVWLVILSLNAAMPLATAAFVALTVDILAAVPLTPGGVGQIDAAYAALLALISGPVFNVGAAVLVVRFISYWSFLVFTGIVTLAAGFGDLLHATPAADSANHAVALAPAAEPERLA
ncbi:MAG: flippase-like domain-containing protein [Anaerolineales bacterium]|nr:flippase-like domain-containing protein [Anaerolineales bacterium]